MRMILRWASTACALGALALVPLAAQTKPANATAQCKDGTYSTAKSKQGACSNHGGVETWYADGVKSDTKAAAKSTKDAAASAGKATAGAAKIVGKDTEKAAKATANGAETAAKETKDATKTAAKATAGAAKGAASGAANAVKNRPPDAPSDATAKCKDGSYSKAAQHSGACSGHGGVAEWYK